MPPPRLLRPLRPRQPARTATATRARGVSHRASDATPRRRRGGAPDGRDAAPPSGSSTTPPPVAPDAPRDAAAAPPDPPPTGWLRALAGRVAALVSPPSPSPSQYEAAGLLLAAESCHRQFIDTLRDAASELETFSSAPAASLAQAIHRSLRALRVQAHQDNDSTVEQQPNPSTSTRPFPRQEHGNPASGTLTSHSLAPKTQEPASEGGTSLSGRKTPTVSFTDPNVSNADLRLQVQHLVEQVRRLTEQLATRPTLDRKTPPAKPSVTSAPSLSTTQAIVKPVAHVENPPESLMATPMQQSKDAEGILQSSTDAPAPSQTTAASLSEIDQSSNPTPMRRHGLGSQAKAHNEEMSTLLSYDGHAQGPVSTPPPASSPAFDEALGAGTEGQRLVRETHAQSGLMKTPDHAKLDNRLPHPVDTPTDQTSSTPPPTQAPLGTSAMSEQSLLDELFPEAGNYIQPYHGTRNPYPKLNLPTITPVVQAFAARKKLSSREKYIQAFQRSAEKLTALQLLHCSTELTEADFRRLVPKGRHIDGWARDGDFHQVIPGRDPLSLQRLPFYYLIFKNSEAALRYQNNAYRLQKLSKLHGRSSSISAIPPPPGFLENGEDINAALSSYLLTPTGQNLQLNMLMQPYNPALARLIENGGYAPIVPSTTHTDKPIHKVLFYIEGYEPSPYDLYQIFKQDAAFRGLAWPFLHEHQSVHRLRDIVNLKAYYGVSTANPSASSTIKRKLAEMKDHDPYAGILAQDGGDDDDDDDQSQDAKVIKQVVMNRVYNRWVVEFSEEAGARRFARLWHRKELPMQNSAIHRTWRDMEELRMCNAEYLW